MKLCGTGNWIALVVRGRRDAKFPRSPVVGSLGRSVLGNAHRDRYSLAVRFAFGITTCMPTRVDLALDKAFVIIDRHDPYRGNVAPLTAECYSESRLSNRKTAGRKVCVEPVAL